MQPATTSVRIQRPHGDVQELLLDLSTHARFLDHLVTDWTPTSDSSRGVGATATMRWRDQARHGEIAIVVTEVTPERIVEETSGGRGMKRRMRVTYAIEPVSDSATQVTTSLELLEGSAVDRASWPLTKTHLERAYAQAMLRLKAMLEAAPHRPPTTPPSP
jgi:hypothetical protein